MMNRRDFVLHTGCAAAGLLVLRHVPAWAQAPAAANLDRGWAKVTPLAEGVWATIADGSKGAQAMSNGGIIAGRDGVLIIEGHLSVEGAALEVEAAKALGKAPIYGAVNTHYHFDHTFGNARYAQDKIPILAHPDTVALMREQYIGMKGKTSMMTQSVEKQIASAKLPAAREHLTADLEVMKGLTSAIESTTITVPDKPVATFPFQINLGGITAVLEHRPGHTRTDLVVRVPERNVMFTGDLLFNGMYPVAFDANMTAWRAELDRMIADKNMTYVPGHGQVSKAADVRAFADVFDDLRAHAEKSKKAGVPAAEAAHTYVVPDRFKNLFIFAWGFTIAAAIEKYYQELK